MKECTKFKTCSFVNCDPSFHQLTSIDQYIENYCHGDKVQNCIRIKIEDRLGSVHVPSNMMPDGLPLPGTHQRDWSEIALEFEKHI